MREHAPLQHPVRASPGPDRMFHVPSSDMALIHIIEEEYPDLWESWRSRLEQWQRTQGLSAEWVTEGKWRLRECGKNDEDSHY